MDRVFVCPVCEDAPGGELEFDSFEQAMEHQEEFKHMVVIKIAKEGGGDRLQI